MVTCPDACTCMAEEQIVRLASTCTELILQLCTLLMRGEGGVYIAIRQQYDTRHTNLVLESKSVHCTHGWIHDQQRPSSCLRSDGRRLCATPSSTVPSTTTSSINAPCASASEVRVEATTVRWATVAVRCSSPSQDLRWRATPREAPTARRESVVLRRRCTIVAVCVTVGAHNQCAVGLHGLLARRVGTTGVASGGGTRLSVAPTVGVRHDAHRAPVTIHDDGQGSSRRHGSEY